MGRRTAADEIRSRLSEDGHWPGTEVRGVTGPGWLAVGAILFVVVQVQASIAEELVEPGAIWQRREYREPSPEPVADLLRREPHRARCASQCQPERGRGIQVERMQLKRARQGGLLGEGGR